MKMKSKFEYLQSLLSPAQREELGRVQDQLQEDPMYLEHSCEGKEEEENA